MKEKRKDNVKKHNNCIIPPSRTTGSCAGMFLGDQQIEG
jgi:hypothetical protein